MEKPQYPMRINRYLALKNHSTRRGADEMIEKNQVLINGRVASLGDKVNEDDKIEVLTSKTPKLYLYFAYHKPAGVITHSPQEGEKEIKDMIPMRGVFPVGRLDKSSHGLMILTNDGRITDRLLNPDHPHEKEYIVTVAEKLRPNFKAKMEAGVNIEGYVTKPCKVEPINNFIFKIILSEGKKHQLRRMVAALFNQVRDIKRTRVMNIRLGELKPGEYRPLQGVELEKFLKSLSLMN